MLAVVFVVAGFASYWTADAGQTVGSRALPPADKVLLFGIPRLDLGDVTPEKMPNLVELGRRGAIGSLRVKTQGAEPDVAEAYASIGAGEATATGAAGTTAYGAHDAYLGTTAIEAQRLRTGRRLDGAVVIPAVPRLVAAGVPIGTLAETLAGADRTIGVVANADTRSLQGRTARAAPAALAASDSSGVVAHGEVAAGLVREDPQAPFGLTVDRQRFVAAVLDGLEDADVIVADPGETSRAQQYLPEQSAREGVESRHRALERTDTVLGDLARAVPPDTRIIVFGVTPGAKRWSLTPIVVAGSGVVPGRLGSPSTHRAGMATMGDLAASVLDTLGVPADDSLRGSPLRETPGEVSWDHNRRFDQMFTTHSTTTRAQMVAAIVAQSALFLAALVFLGLGRPGPALARFFEWASLLFASWPLATFLVRMSVALNSLSYATLAVTWGLAVAVAVLARMLTRDAISALVGVALATFTVIVVDLATGAHLLFGSFFGYSPDTSSRYFGINNSVFAILSACAVLVATFAVERGRERGDPGRGLWVAGVLFAVAVVVDGAPWMGADVGGILTLVPVLGVTLWAFTGRRLRWPYLVAAVVAGVAVLGVVIGIDLAHAPDERTHIGRFFLGVGSGDDETLPAMLSAKWRANTAALAQSMWTWAVPLTAAYSIYVLVVARGWRRLLPPGSAIRTGVVSMLILGVVGWLLNDSGVVVTALVLGYLGPMTILVALRDLHARSEAPRAPGRPDREVLVP